MFDVSKNIYVIELLAIRFVFAILVCRIMKAGWIRGIEVAQVKSIRMIQQKFHSIV